MERAEEGNTSKAMARIECFALSPGVTLYFR